MDFMNIYVGRLPRAITEAKIKELFEQYGEVTKINLIKDKLTGMIKGFAFVDMPDNDSAQAAINALNGVDYEGQRLVVSEARPKEDRPRMGGNRFGGGDRRPSRFNNNRF